MSTSLYTNDAAGQAAVDAVPDPKYVWVNGSQIIVYTDGDLPVVTEDATQATAASMLGYHNIVVDMTPSEQADALTGAPTIDLSAKLQAAITLCETTGKILLIPSAYTIKAGEVSGGAGNLTIDGGGTIMLPDADLAYGLRWYPPTSARYAVTACTTVEYPYSTQESTRIECAGAGNFAPGDVLFFETRTPYAFDATVDEGELIAVHSVDAANGWIYTAGKCAKNYSGASMYVRKLSTRRLRIHALRITHAGDMSDSTIPLRWALFIVGAIDPVVNVDVENLPGRGVVLASCWRGTATVRGRNLKDDASNQFYGYVADAMSCTRGTRFHVFAEKCRHALTTNVYTNGDPAAEANRLWDVGGPRECVISGVATNTTSAAWDTHAGCWDIVFRDVSALWTHQVTDDVLGAGRQYVIQDRGCNTRFEQVFGIGSMHGCNLAGQGVNYGQDNITTFQGSIYGRAPVTVTKYAISMDPEHAGEDGTYRKRVIVRESHIEQFKALNIISGAPELIFRSTVFDNVTQLRTGTYNDMQMINCERITYSGVSNEPVGIQNGAELVATGMKFRGGNISALFRGIGSSGNSCTLKHAYTASTVSGSPVFSDANAGVTLNSTSVAV